MNDWRSTFAGVNDREADWEQVTVFLVRLVEEAACANRPDKSDVLRVGWVAFSSHDQTGDDLRRRFDDPDITWIDHTRPVVYAGAGSHSGAYLPGEYLVRVEPPALHRFFAAVSRARAVLAGPREVVQVLWRAFGASTAEPGGLVRGQLCERSVVPLRRCPPKPSSRRKTRVTCICSWW